MCQSRSDLFPSMEPGNEEPRTSDASFVDACMARIADDAEKLGWQFGNSVLSSNDKWGLVWRADFEVKNQSMEQGYVNRVICWSALGDDGIGVAFAVGQRGERLK
jgi:hypothetical protein